jgi:hypothetical protein
MVVHIKKKRFLLFIYFKIEINLNHSFLDEVHETYSIMKQSYSDMLQLLRKYYTLNIS